MIATSTVSATPSRLRRDLRPASLLRGRRGGMALLLAAEVTLLALLAASFSLPEPLALGARLLLSF